MSGVEPVWAATLSRYNLAERGRGGIWRDAEALKASVRKDVQVRILPPPPSSTVSEASAFLGRTASGKVS